MLTQAFDRPGVAFGLSEPVVLNDLVGWRRRGADPRRHGQVLQHALAQLARPFTAGEAAVLKPSNVVNPLAAGLLTLRPDAHAVLLYAPLPAFLASVARKGMWCRLWARELLEGYLQDGVVKLGFGPSHYFRQSDLQVAAVGWLAQHALFRAITERFGPARVRTLSSTRLVAAPILATAAVAQHFGLDLDALDHPAFSTNSKTGEAFGPGQRDRELASAHDHHAEEIDMVVRWANAVAAAAELDLAMPSPLDI
jgi:hypothetical protein